MDDFLTINFRRSEFLCSPECGCSHDFNMDLHFIMQLQELRTQCGFPIVINSGYRCPEWNAKKGGSETSWHMQGLAVDIHCVDNIRRLAIVKHAIALSFSDIGIAKTFIHLDNRPQVKQRIRVY